MKPPHESSLCLSTAPPFCFFLRYAQIPLSVYTVCSCGSQWMHQGQALGKSVSGSKLCKSVSLSWCCFVWEQTLVSCAVKENQIVSMCQTPDDYREIKLLRVIFWSFLFFLVWHLPLRLLRTVTMCSVIACDVPFNCVKELICCSHLSISTLLLKSLERSPR